ncbi:MAG: hypothetical protein ACI4HM_04005 [Ruminococcus sp.]
MITVFNRKELIITTDMNRQSDVRNILATNHINYVVKTTNLQNAPVVGASRGRNGSFGINQNYSYEYKIYVHKKDYDKSKLLIK